jgi:hypothetical protein
VGEEELEGVSMSVRKAELVKGRVPPMSRPEMARGLQRVALDQVRVYKNLWPVMHPRTLEGLARSFGEELARSLVSPYRADGTPDARRLSDAP